MNTQVIKIASTVINQDNHGRYCLNDLHIASGGDAKNRPNYFLELKKTQDLITEIELAGIPAISAKPGVGTFAVKPLVYAYAMWSSPKFMLHVIDVFDKSVTGINADHEARLSRLEQQLITAPKAVLHVDSVHEQYAHTIKTVIKSSGKHGISKNCLYDKCRSIPSVIKNKLINDFIELGNIFTLMIKINGSRRSSLVYYWRK